MTATNIHPGGELQSEAKAPIGKHSRPRIGKGFVVEIWWKYGGA